MEFCVVTDGKKHPVQPGRKKSLGLTSSSFMDMVYFLIAYGAIDSKGGPGDPLHFVTNSLRRDPQGSAWTEERTRDRAFRIGFFRTQKEAPGTDWCASKSGPIRFFNGADLRMSRVFSLPRCSMALLRTFLASSTCGALQCLWTVGLLLLFVYLLLADKLVGFA